MTATQAGVTWHAPGRVNFIGEHTDYNDGFVLPFALPVGVTARVSLRDDDMLTIASATHAGDNVSLPLRALAPGARHGWSA